ncbi:MAG: hypothetical protein IJ458_03905 [Clostridia bacterium]|nr:hypothetical protein [Clostridia bacterium]
MQEVCLKISIDCQLNDSVDIQCGGPEYLGYDFYVKQVEVDKMISFIKKTFDKLSVPIVALYCDRNTLYKKESNKVWTEDRIYRCVANNTAGLNLDTGYSL